MSVSSDQSDKQERDEKGSEVTEVKAVIPPGPEATCAGSFQLIPPNSTLRDIEKTHVKLLPLLQYAQSVEHVAVVEKVAEVDARVEQLRAAVKEDSQGEEHGIQVVGFDTETKPQFAKASYANPVALIQLATQKVVILFRTCKFREIPESLLAFLADTSILKVGIGVNSDVKAIRTRSPNFDDSGSFFNLEGCYRQAFPNLHRLGLRNLSATVLHLRMTKGAQLCNWEGPFSQSMTSYAANDAITGLMLFRGLVGSVALATEAPKVCVEAAEREEEEREAQPEGEVTRKPNPTKKQGPKSGATKYSRCATAQCKGQGTVQDRGDKQWYCEPCFVAWEQSQ